MKTQYPYIRSSRKFYGKFEVVISDSHSIPCYNLATASSIFASIKGKQKC